MNTKILKLLFSFVLVLITISMSVGQRSMQNIIRKYKNDQGVISVNYKEDINDFFKNDSISFKTKINAVDVIAFKEGKDMSDADRQTILANLHKENYELLINAKQKDGKLALYTLGEEDNITKIYAQAKKDNYNVYFTMSGNIVLSELPQLGLNFDGADIFNMIPEVNK